MRMTWMTVTKNPRAKMAVRASLGCTSVSPWTPVRRNMSHTFCLVWSCRRHSTGSGRAMMMISKARLVPVHRQSKAAFHRRRVLGRQIYLRELRLVSLFPICSRRTDQPKVTHRNTTQSCLCISQESTGPIASRPICLPSARPCPIYLIPIPRLSKDAPAYRQSKAGT